MFPRFLTGLDLLGLAPFTEGLRYHLYLQGTRDLDDEYINIPVDRHVGGSLEFDVASGWSLEGNLGSYGRTDGTDVRYQGEHRLVDRHVLVVRSE